MIKIVIIGLELNVKSLFKIGNACVSICVYIIMGLYVFPKKKIWKVNLWKRLLLLQ